MEIPELRITIRCCEESVRWAGAAVQGLCACLAMDEQSRYDVRLCVVEAATNCLRHAYRNAADGWIGIILRLSDDDWLQVFVLDHGEALPEEKLTSADLDLGFSGSEDEVPEGGRGLFLIKALMDRVTFHTDGFTNVLTMRKRLIRKVPSNEQPERWALPPFPSANPPTCSTPLTDLSRKDDGDGTSSQKPGLGLG